ncbi:MAG: hypothetical protein KGI50_03355 [Patescibacteria group bacterium]|nr:hypothetical protein [Patescibacteria group bacterium]MDE2438328.1 hypothetical protein [Patescibacteria group bacterium]
MENLLQKESDPKNKKEAVKDLKEVLRTPLDNNHHYVVVRQDLNQNTLRIFLESEDGTILEFTDFVREEDGVPKKIGIREQPGWGANTKNFFIVLTVEELRDPKNIFTFLHELGHLQIFPKWKKWGEENPEKKKTVDLWRMTYDVKVSEGAQINLQEERDAWAAAIHIARTIRDTHHVDLFKLFHTKHDFMRWLRIDQLDTYEREVEELGGLSKGKHEMLNERIREQWEEEMSDPTLVEDEDFSLAA